MDCENGPSDWFVLVLLIPRLLRNVKSKSYLRFSLMERTSAGLSPL
jgi:hypothetical protein